MQNLNQPTIPTMLGSFLLSQLNRDLAIKIWKSVKVQIEDFKMLPLQTSGLLARVGRLCLMIEVPGTKYALALDDIVVAMHMETLRPKINPAGIEMLSRELVAVIEERFFRFPGYQSLVEKMQAVSISSGLPMATILEQALTLSPSPEPDPVEQSTGVAEIAEEGLKALHGEPAAEIISDLKPVEEKGVAEEPARVVTGDGQEEIIDPAPVADLRSKAAAGDTPLPDTAPRGAVDGLRIEEREFSTDEAEERGDE